MRQAMRKILFVLLTAAFIAGIGMMAYQKTQYALAELSQKQALTLATATEPTTQPATEPEVQLPEETVPMAEAPQPDETAQTAAQLDIAALQAVNSDVLGWISIPGTNVDYPLLSAENNGQYLHTAWDGSYSYAGSIYLECQNSRDLTDFYTLIYGHNMADGSMFGNLILYGQQEFRDSHPYVYLRAGDRVYRYEIFAAYTADITSDTYRIGFQSVERKQQAIDYYLQQSQITASRTVTHQDKIITLSTCTGTGDYSYRWVVQAVLDAQW